MATVHAATVSEPWIVMGVSEWTPAQELTRFNRLLQWELGIGVDSEKPIIEHP